MPLNREHVARYLAVAVRALERPRDAVNAMWQMMGLRWDIAHMSLISLLYNTVTLLFVLTIVNRFAKKVSPQLYFSAAELLTIYVILCLSTAIGGHICMQILLPIIGYAFAYATPENDWQSLFTRYAIIFSVKDSGEHEPLPTVKGGVVYDQPPRDSSDL